MQNTRSDSIADLMMLAHSLCNSADACRGWGQYVKAEPFYKEALAIVEQVLGPNHIVVSVILNSLAVLYKGAGKLDEAEALYRRALAIFERAYGPGMRDRDHTAQNSGFADLIGYSMQGG